MTSTLIDEIPSTELIKHLAESEASFKIGGIIGVTLYKCDRTLRQVFIVPPRTHIPPHSHPDVESKITFISGDMLFYRDGKEMELISPSDDGRSFVIKAGVAHGAYTFDRVGMFMNEQTWFISPKAGVHLNWNGAPINHEHAVLLAR